jgi:hypothetical protein
MLQKIQALVDKKVNHNEEREESCQETLGNHESARGFSFLENFKIQHEKSDLGGKKSYENDLIENIRNGTLKDPKQMFQDLKHYRNPNTPGIPPLEKSDGTLTQDDPEKVNHINSKFISFTHGGRPREYKNPFKIKIETEVKIEISRLKNILRRKKSLRIDENNPQLTDFEKSITGSDVEKRLKILDNDKACGPDKIAVWLLKAGGRFLCDKLAIVFTKSITQCIIPREWKLANVVALHKKGERTDAGNYRPISLTSHITKLLEGIIAQFLLKKLEDKNWFKFQGGFRKKLSTVATLAYVTERWWLKTDPKQKNVVNAVAMDISKCFDRTWRDGILWKARHNAKIGGNALLWISSFLSERKQRVVYNKSASTWQDVLNGTPQGSSISPLLFLIFINDISDNILNKINLFADDTILWSELTDEKEQIRTLNIDMKELYKWSCLWRVDFAPHKCHHIRLCRTKKWKLTGKSVEECKLLASSAPGKIKFGDITLTTVHEIKFLGLTIQQDLQYRTHFDGIVTFWRKEIGFMKLLFCKR